MRQFEGILLCFSVSLLTAALIDKNVTTAIGAAICIISCGSSFFKKEK